MNVTMYLHREATGTPPPVDVYETGDSLVLEMDLPGMDPGDVLIKVHEDVIIIEGVKRQKSEEKGFRYICMERNFDSFRRMIAIPVPINSTEGKAVYAGGVLTLTFPKARERVIKIKIEK